MDITGTDGKDTLTGTAEFDELLYGLGGSDLIDGGGGPYGDTLYGGGGQDTLIGSDQLFGGSGADVLIATAADTLFIMTLTDLIEDEVVVFSVGEGHEVQLDGSVGFLTTDAMATLYEIADAVVFLDGPIYGSENADIIDFSRFAYVEPADKIYLGGGRDHFVGHDGLGSPYDSGKDVVDGGAGADTMEGGDGDDTYTLNTVDDVVIEQENEGRDTIIVSFSDIDLSLYSNVEFIDASATAKDLLVTGTGADEVVYAGKGDDLLYGGDGIDQLHGGNGNNVLDGGKGQDYLYGGRGVDTFYMDHNDDLIADNGGGAIVIVKLSKVDLDDFEINGPLEVKFTGSADNSLKGSVKGDTEVYGGAGNDSLNSAQAFLYGGDGNDSLTAEYGSAYGGAGNDTLLADTQRGGTGDDTYIYVRDSRDDSPPIDIAEKANEGTDTLIVKSQHDPVTLPANIEIMVAGDNKSAQMIGNSAANTLIGNSYDNTLDGAGGADTLIGGGGNDLFVVDNVGDVIKLEQGQGASITSTLASYKLIKGAQNGTIDRDTGGTLTGNELDNILTGDEGDDSLTGGTGNDLLEGQSGVDTLKGDSGSDILYSDGGADQLYGGADQDAFVFNTTVSSTGNAPMVRDYKDADDLIVLDRSGGKFNALYTGALYAEEFYVGSSATKSTHRILYNPSNGGVYYDADGAGGTSAQLIFVMSPKVTLSYDDFLVI